VFFNINTKEKTMIVEYQGTDGRIYQLDSDKTRFDQLKEILGFSMIYAAIRATGKEPSKVGVGFIFPRIRWSGEWTDTIQTVEEQQSTERGFVDLVLQGLQTLSENSGAKIINLNDEGENI
jgi:hypothetical protein